MYQSKINIDSWINRQTSSPHGLLTGKANGTIENAITQVQEKLRRKFKAIVEIGGRIAKEFDIAMIAKLPRWIN